MRWRWFMKRREEPTCMVFGFKFFRPAARGRLAGNLIIRCRCRVAMSECILPTCSTYYVHSKSYSTYCMAAILVNHTYVLYFVLCSSTHTSTARLHVFKCDWRFTSATWTSSDSGQLRTSATYLLCRQNTRSGQSHTRSPLY